MKTAKELLKQLPTGWYEDVYLYHFKRNTLNFLYGDIGVYDSLLQCVTCVVVWGDTIAGLTAWGDLSNAIKNGKEYPEYPCQEELLKKINMYIGQLKQKLDGLYNIKSTINQKNQQ